MKKCICLLPRRKTSIASCSHATFGIVYGSACLGSAASNRRVAKLTQSPYEVPMMSLSMSAAASLMPRSLSRHSIHGMQAGDGHVCARAHACWGVSPFTCSFLPLFIPLFAHTLDRSFDLSFIPLRVSFFVCLLACLFVPSLLESASFVSAIAPLFVSSFPLPTSALLFDVFFIYLFVGLLVSSLARPSIGLFVCSFIHSFVRSFIRSIIHCSFVTPLICPRSLVLARLFDCLSIRSACSLGSLILSLVRSLVRLCEFGKVVLSTRCT